MAKKIKPPGEVKPHAGTANLKPFQPGHDDRRNLKGRPPIVKDIKAYMKERLAEPVNVGSGVSRLDALMTKLLTMAYGGNMKAMEMALAYGYGRPTQGLELTGAQGGPILTHDFSGLTNDQVRERIEQLKAITDLPESDERDADQTGD